MIFLLVFAYPLKAQVFIQEDFSGGVPPSGWTISDNAENWISSDTHTAGGDAPELAFSWMPPMDGISRLISPRMDLTGVTTLKVGFLHSMEQLEGFYSLGVATRSGSGSWHDVWLMDNPDSSFSESSEMITVENDDVGNSQFQICWYFSGSSTMIISWNLDDFLVYQPLDHNVGTERLLTEGQFVPGNNIAPSAIITNRGLQTESFPVSCDLRIGDNSIYVDTLIVNDLQPDSSEAVAFSDFTISDNNALYTLTIATFMYGDMDSSDDSMTGYFNTYNTPRDKVILEIGTGTWCGSCPGAAMGADDMIDNGHDVAVIEYHYDDSFANQNGIYRVIDYYEMMGLPTAEFDGVSEYVGGSENQSMYQTYLPLFQTRDSINTAFSLDIFGDNAGNNYDITVYADKMAEIPSSWTNLALHVVLTESGIQYNWQGQDHLNFVERLMIPNSSGTTLDFSSGFHQEMPLQFTFNTSWSYENCELAVFIQNLDTREILQGMNKALPDLTPLAAYDDNVKLPLITELKGNYPNPFNSQTNISFELAIPGEVTIEVYNLVGQRVCTLFDKPLDAGEHAIVWDAAGYSSGIYFAQLRAVEFSDAIRMTLLK